MNCLSVFDHFVGLAIKGLTLQLHINKLLKMYELKLQFAIWQPNNLVKHTQTILQQIADKLFCVWPFCGVGA